MLSNFIFAFLATFGYCIVFNVPKKHLSFAALGGGLGWMGYISLYSTVNSPVIAVFIASTIVAIWGEILSVKVKDLVTLFIIPGIIPLVPGSGMYYTMLAIIEKRL